MRGLSGKETRKEAMRGTKYEFSIWFTSYGRVTGSRP